MAGFSCFFSLKQLIASGIYNTDTSGATYTVAMFLLIVIGQLTQGNAKETSIVTGGTFKFVGIKLLTQIKRVMDRWPSGHGGHGHRK